MFQKTANAYNLPVRITLSNGERLRGELVLPRTMPLAEAVNRDEQFLSFLSSEGQLMVIAKQSISTMSEFDLPERNQLDQHQSRFDPMILLGVNASSSNEQIREAYLQKVRLYHPDQFVSVKLPPEVLEYMEATFQHVHDAYEELVRKNREGVQGKAA